MLVKILGGIDVIAGLILIFGGGRFIPNEILIFLGIIVLLKSGIGMLKDFGSLIDLIAGLVLLISILINIPLLISVIAGLLILQKGVVSFIG